MAIVNKRNAVVGWAAIKTTKRVLVGKKPPAKRPHRRRNRAAVAGALAAIGVITVWRHMSGAAQSE